MSHKEAYSILRANVGKIVDIVLDGKPIPLMVASVDSDGALFRTVEHDPQHPLSEFWAAFDHIDRIEQGRLAAN